MAAEESDFFSRWSRRKALARGGQTPTDDPAVVASPVVPATPAAQGPAVQVERHPSVEGNVRADASSPKDAPPLTLDDVAGVTPDADFTPFMARQVPAEVRNAAVKKLFSDPHFQTMDGLDVYIDDYSQPSPLSAVDMARMVGAQFLKLVDNPAPPEPVDATAEAPATDPPEPHDDHADLQLQPDHAPEPRGTGGGAG